MKAREFWIEGWNNKHACQDVIVSNSHNYGTSKKIHVREVLPDEKTYEQGVADGKTLQDEKYKNFIDRMKTLGQAMPPNAVSMNIKKALKEQEQG
jgi:hypothetical protein